MKNANDCAKKFGSLISKMAAAEPPAFTETDDPLAVLVQSFLLWESTTEKAVAAWDKLRTATVDYNELRVSMPDEVLGLIGARYPRGQERAERLRAALRGVYLREHAMTLESLPGSGKRDARRYLDSLDGMVPFVAARVMLVSLEAHAIPVDVQLRDALIDEGAAHDEVDELELSTWLSRQVKSGDGFATHLSLQAWAEKQAATRKPTKKKTTKKAATKKTTKKTTTKKSSTKKSSTKKSSTKKAETKKTTTKKASTRKKTTRKTKSKA